MNAMPATAAAPTFALRRTERDWTTYAVSLVLVVFAVLAVATLVQARLSAPPASAGAALPRSAALTPELHAYGARTAVEPVVIAAAAAPAPLLREAHFASALRRGEAASTRSAATDVVVAGDRALHFYGA
jgi:hypothetical protein